MVANIRKMVRITDGIIKVFRDIFIRTANGNSESSRGAQLYHAQVSYEWPT